MCMFSRQLETNYFDVESTHSCCGSRWKQFFGQHARRTASAQQKRQMAHSLLVFLTKWRDLRSDCGPREFCSWSWRPTEHSLRFSQLEWCGSGSPQPTHSRAPAHSNNYTRQRCWLGSQVVQVPMGCKLSKWDNKEQKQLLPSANLSGSLWANWSPHAGAEGSAGGATTTLAPTGAACWGIAEQRPSGAWQLLLFVIQSCGESIPPSPSLASPSPLEEGRIVSVDGGLRQKITVFLVADSKWCQT